MSHQSRAGTGEHISPSVLIGITFGKALKHFLPMLNDLEQERPAMNLSGFTQPSFGMVTSNADSTVNCDPAEAAAGTSVTCTILDSGGESTC